ncbi:S-adenosyl-L-methionine-dependent methyltransferase [Xylariaceae sp. FL0594]|nr:S-adenosyl-L-methionine-dependent methyltransferase [Xylariaceae sp. FL0594]
MPELHSRDLESFPRVDEIPERLDEQHYITTKILGFLIHPNIPSTSPTLKIADIGTGTGFWLYDVAKTLSLPPTCQLVGYDITPSAFPRPEDNDMSANVTFRTQDMLQPFPESELGTYDIVAVRFVSSATTRREFAHAVGNLVSLLKPGGWLQWIDSCNFSLYNTVPGTSRAACQDLYDGLEPFRAKDDDDDDDLVIGLMMREKGQRVGANSAKRQDVFRESGLVEVHEDVFSTDRLQDASLQIRERGTKNILSCFVGSLEDLIARKKETGGWTRERVESLGERAMREVDDGVYHTLDQVCIIGKKPTR